MPKTVECLSRLPHDWHSIGTKSLSQLIDDSGYYCNPDVVTEQSLKAALVSRPDLCDAWIGYSQDRRTHCGWTIQTRDDMFIVQYYPNGSTILKFKDKPAACAAFAIREIASLTRGGQNSVATKSLWDRLRSIATGGRANKNDLVIQRRSLGLRRRMFFRLREPSEHLCVALGERTRHLARSQLDFAAVAFETMRVFRDRGRH